jgi:hypothetical protein
LNPQDQRFYTYIYSRQADGTPYYIGKGQGNRAFSKHRRGHISVPPAARILIQYWPSEAEAFEMEKYFIQLFGRKDNGTGILRNMTDGGEGISGYAHTNEAKKSIGKWGSQTKELGIGIFAPEYQSFENSARGGQVGGRVSGLKCKEQGLGIFASGMAAKGGHAVTLEQHQDAGFSGAHTRWHVARGIVSSSCSLCVPQSTEVQCLN